MTFCAFGTWPNVAMFQNFQGRESVEFWKGVGVSQHFKHLNVKYEKLVMSRWEEVSITDRFA